MSGNQASRPTETKVYFLDIENTDRQNLGRMGRGQQEQEQLPCSTTHHSNQLTIITDFKTVKRRTAKGSTPTTKGWRDGADS